MTRPDVLQLTVQELETFLVRGRDRLSPIDYEIAEALVDVLHTVHLTLQDRHATIAKLRKILLGVDAQRKPRPASEPPSSDEGAEADEAGNEPATVANSAPGDDSEESSPAADDPEETGGPGHGRNGTDKYPGVTPTIVEHSGLGLGGVCPGCQTGKLCTGRPRRIIRIIGQPSLAARMWEARDLRCSSCGEVFHAPLPIEAKGPKYDDSAGAMIALMKYGSGFPFYRLQRHQANLGIPLPASVAWEVVRDAAGHLVPVLEELYQQSAKADVIYNDDTSMRILASMAGAHGEPWVKDGQLRTGLFTSA